MAFYGRTATGRLKKPKGIETYGDMGILPEIGQLVQQMPSVSAGTIGRVVEIIDCQVKYGPQCKGHFIVCEFLDGRTDSGWPHSTWPITAEAVQEVKDFYIQDGRPDRIKVSW